MDGRKGEKISETPVKAGQIAQREDRRRTMIKESYRKVTLERERHLVEQLRQEAYEKEADKERRQKEADKKATKGKLKDDGKIMKRRRKIRDPETS